MNKFIMGWIFVFQGLVAIVTLGLVAPNWTLSFYTYSLKRKLYKNLIKGTF